MSLFKRTAAVILAVTLLLSGCAGGNTTWAFKSGDVSVPTGLYILYEMSSVAALSEKLAELDPSVASAKPSELLKMTVEGQSAADWVGEETKKSVREYFAVKQKFDALGLQLSESGLAMIESNVKSLLSNNSAFYENIGVSEASIKEYYIGSVRENMLFETLYGEGGEFAVAEDELNTYFKGHYVMLDALPFYKPSEVPEGETKTLDELGAEVGTVVEEYLKRLQAGENIEDIAYEWQLKNTTEENKTGVEKPSKEDLRVIISDKDYDTFGEAFIDAAFRTTVGTSSMAEDTSFYVLFDRVDILSDKEKLTDYKSDVLHALKDDEFSAKLLEWGSAVTMESNNATLDKYKASKLKLDDTAA